MQPFKHSTAVGRSDRAARASDRADDLSTRTAARAMLWFTGLAIVALWAAATLA